MVFKPGDKVRLTRDVGVSFLERNEIYVSGTKDSIAEIITAEEFLRFGNNGLVYNLEEIKAAVAQGRRYPVRYEKIIPISKSPYFGFDIIDQSREEGTDYVDADNLELIE